MLPPSYMSWVTDLCESPQHVLYDLAGRYAHSRIPNLLPADQTAVYGLLQRLTDNTPLNRACFDQVKNRPQRSSKLEALPHLHVGRRQVGVMQYQDPGNIAVAPEIRRDCHVELRRIQVRQVIEAERCMVAVNTLDFLVSVPRPECPKHKVGPIGHREQSKPVNAAVLADPVSDLKVVRMGVLGESGGLGLL